MRVLLARVSILLACVLAVSAAATNTDADAGGPYELGPRETSKSKFSGRPSWTSFTTRRVPRRPVFRFFWFRRLPADFRRTPLISTLGSRS